MDAPSSCLKWVTFFHPRPPVAVLRRMSPRVKRVYWQLPVNQAMLVLQMRPGHPQISDVLTSYSYNSHATIISVGFHISTVCSLKRRTVENLRRIERALYSIFALR